MCGAGPPGRTWLSPKGYVTTWCRMSGSACLCASFVRLRSRLAMPPLLSAVVAPSGPELDGSGAVRSDDATMPPRILRTWSSTSGLPSLEPRLRPRPPRRPWVPLLALPMGTATPTSMTRVRSPRRADQAVRADALPVMWLRCRRGQGRPCSSWWGTSVRTLRPVTRSVSPCGALRSLVPHPAALG